MKKNLIGIVQGRLSIAPKKSLQYFPKKYEKEFLIAKKIKCDYIELFSERKINENNPIWSNEGIEKYISLSKKNSVKLINFCDDHSISKNINSMSYNFYFKKLIANIKKLKIKNFILPLYGKSMITDNNFQKFNTKIYKLTNFARREKINIFIEANISPETFFKLKAFNEKNFFFLFDTGNRINLKSNMSQDILKFGNKIGLVHLKDKNSINKNVKIGTGNVNFQEVFNNLKNIKYKNNFTLESIRGKNPIITAKKNIIFFNKLINIKLTKV
jgi:L-ribulose-5-phosphate 3-epimerase